MILRYESLNPTLFEITLIRQVKYYKTTSLLTFAFTLSPSQATLLFLSLQPSLELLAVTYRWQPQSRKPHPTNNRKKGLAVDIKVPRDGIGSDHIKKTSTNSQEAYSAGL